MRKTRERGNQKRKRKGKTSEKRKGKIIPPPKEEETGKLVS
jgi:hypothetical protein